MKVALHLRIRRKDGSRVYAQPAYSANGKIKPFYALISGQPEHHPEGVYCLRYVRDGKRVWEVIGTDPQLAVTTRLKRERLFDAKESGIEVVEEADKPIGNPLLEVVAEYLAEVKAGKSKKTYAAYSLTLSQFSSVCTKPTLEAVERKDILLYQQFLRENANKPLLLLRVSRITMSGET